MDDPSTASFAPPAARPPGAGPEHEVALKLWVVLARAFTAVTRQMEAEVARHGLTIAEFGVLEALLHKGPLLLGDIQRKLLVSSGGSTYLVDRLAAKGLVERRDCPRDRRARYVVLTPAGDALITRVFPEHARRVSQVLAGLTEQEQVQATALLRTLGRSAAALPPPSDGQ